MATWREFAEFSPALAAHGERMLRIGKDKPAGSLAGGLAYLATIRKDGGPRLHPISPALIDGRLYAFILHRSPKKHDLLRDGRYALHSWPYPMDEQNYNDDEFYLSGTATWIDDPALRRAYRDRLRTAVPAAESFVLHLAATADSLRPRIEARRGHYMPASLLDSQLATLEPLEPDEVGAIIEATPPQPDVFDAAIDAVRAWLTAPQADR